MKRILTILVLIALAGPGHANPVADRPLSRDDAMATRLALPRPVARPQHILLDPVVVETRQPDVRPRARTRFQPEARWDFKPGGQVWTRAAMAALATHAADLTRIVPRDITTWCPGYPNASVEARRAFWVGMMSALSKYESTYDPRAVGGGGRWFGLLQIYPDTARRYGCRAQTGEALKNPAENLSCAARIMAVTVARDGAVAVNDGRWRGVAADWGPMQNARKISEMAAWTRSQSYCVARPNPPVAVSTMTATRQPD